MMTKYRSMLVDNFLPEFRDLYLVIHNYLPQGLAE